LDGEPGGIEGEVWSRTARHRILELEIGIFMRRFELWIAALLSCLTVAGCSKSKANQAPPVIPEVFVTSPTTDEITDYEEFIGHTDAVFTVEVRARVTGYLDRVNFNDGDEVEKGALLFQIDDRPYKAESDRMQATLAQGEARLTRLTADHVRAVNLMNRTAIGREEFDRINGDFEEGKATIGVYTAGLAKAKLDVDFTKVTAPISGRLSRRMVDPGNLVQADVTALTTIVSLDPMYVYFDIDERTILKIRRLIAEGKIKSRQEAELPVFVALSDEPEFPHRGTINFSDNKIDSATGTLRLRGVINNPKPRLLSPGLFVRIRLPVGTAHKSILIDEQAISSEQSNKFVYVVRKTLVKEKDPKTSKEVIDPKTGKVKESIQELAFAQPIKVGSLNSGFRVVNEGLSASDRVIISGLQRVKPGEPVRPFVAKPSKEAAGKVGAAGLPPTPTDSHPKPLVSDVVPPPPTAHPSK
jgi:membrane fusion protein, multidrug efflux system